MQDLEVIAQELSALGHKLDQSTDVSPPSRR
jgi:hypothetical protein